MQRTFVLALTAALMFAGAAAAQNPPAQSGLEDAGYSNVGDLKKDDNGVWRGKANKGGSSTNVSVDFQGNVNSAK
jgi:hypothetical protein